MPKKILLADDSITIQKVVELTLADEDFDVVTVGNGAQAIARVRDLRPDVILCDIIMPERDGYEVCEYVKTNPDLAHIPVLLLTGAFEPFDQHRAQRAGSDGFLAKPFEPAALVSRVKELIAKNAASTAAHVDPEPAALIVDDWVAPPPSPSVAAPFASATGLLDLPSPRALGIEDDVSAGGVAPEELLGSAPEPAAPPIASEPQPMAPAWNQPTMEIDRNEMVAKFRAEASRDISPGTGPISPMDIPQTEPQMIVEDDGPGTGEVAPVMGAFEPSVFDAPSVEPQTQEANSPGMSDEVVERIARRVAQLIGDKVVREVAWEVVPDLAESLIKQEIERLKGDLEPV